MYGASIATPRSRFGGASTVKPWLCSSVATAFQLDASAQAPWTRTIVGFGICFSLRLSELAVPIHPTDGVARARGHRVARR